jgi:ubiquinol-cytochrome c reductase cytochrome c subunit
MTYRYATDEELERSTNKWMAAGAILLLAMAGVFPLYRWFEPTARGDARVEQAAALAAEGESVWQFNCSQCHGLNGEGAVGPALNSKQFLQSATDTQARTLVSVGVPGTQMSAFSLDFGGPLTSEQIKSVVAFVRSWEPNAPDRPDWRSMVGG